MKVRATLSTKENCQSSIRGGCGIRHKGLKRLSAILDRKEPALEDREQLLSLLMMLWVRACAELNVRSLVILLFTLLVSWSFEGTVTQIPNKFTHEAYS